MRGRLVALALAAAIAVVGAGLYFWQNARPSASNDVGVTVVVDRDHPSTTQQMLAESDLVVVGSLTGKAIEYARSSDGRIIHYATAVSVETWVRGRNAAGTEVYVSRSLLSNGQPIVEDGTSPLTVGNRYLLFLKASDVSVTGSVVYSSVGGAQGQFLVAGDILTSLDPSQPTSADFDGKTFSAAVALLTGQ